MREKPVLVAAACALLVARFGFGRLGLGTPRGRTLVFLLFVAMASHGVLDALTDGGRGVGFLIPFSSERFFFPWRPIPVSSCDGPPFMCR